MEVSTLIRWLVFGGEPLRIKLSKATLCLGEHRLGNRRLQHLKLDKFRLVSSRCMLDFTLALLSTGYITLMLNADLKEVAYCSISKYDTPFIVSVCISFFSFRVLGSRTFRMISLYPYIRALLLNLPVLWIQNTLFSSFPNMMQRSL